MTAYHLSHRKCHKPTKAAILLDLDKFSRLSCSTTHDSPSHFANVLIADRLRFELDDTYKKNTKQDYKTLGLDCSFLNATAKLEKTAMQNNSEFSGSASNVQLYTLSEEQLRRLISQRDSGKEIGIPRNNFYDNITPNHKAVTTQDVEQIISRSFLKFNEEFEPPRKKRRGEAGAEILATEQVKRLVDTLEERASKQPDVSEQFIKTFNDKTDRMWKALDQQSQALSSLQEKLESGKSDTSTDKRIDCSADSIHAMKRDMVNRVIQKTKE